MKKLLSYILILVALVGFLFPMVKVSADAAQLGSCIVRDSNQRLISNNQTTSDGCTAEGATWYSNYNQKTGSCTNKSGSYASGWTELACQDGTDTWKWTPAATGTTLPANSSTSGNPNDIGTCTFNQTVSYDQCYKWNADGWNGSNRSSGADNKSGVCTTLGWSRKSCLTDNPGTSFSVTAAVGPVDNSYHLLAPLPCQAGDANCDSNGQLTTFDPTQANNLGGYLNLMIKIFIGLCAVLAMIMIVMGGIEWMTSELPGNKEHGKERIQGAVFGLVLALGAWTLIYTINPNILNTDLSSLQTANVTVGMPEQETASSAVTSDGTPPSGPTNLCSAGIKQTSSGMYACGSIASNVDGMLAAAKAAGMTITGGGYRSADSQKALRIQNCNGNYTDRSAVCNPPTALPGLSNHNNGLAFDLKCNGVLIQSQSNQCYVWLKTNSGSYGLANLPSEPWHWSVDGK